MARLTPLALRYPPGPLHERDPRLKLASLLALSLAILVASGPTLAIPVLLLFGGYRYARQPLGRSLLALKPLILIALLIAVSRTITAAAEIRAPEAGAATSAVWSAVTASPSAAPLFSWLGALRLPTSAVLSGVDYAVRLLLVALFGQLFLATTSRGRIIDTLRWACSPLPPTTRAYVPLAVAVALSSFPLIARSMQQTRDACVARGVNPKQSPALLVRRIVHAAVDEVPLRIARIADAVAVRGFSLHGTPPRFHPAAADLRLGLQVALAVALTLLLPLLVSAPRI